MLELALALLLKKCYSVISAHIHRLIITLGISGCGFTALRYSNCHAPSLDQWARPQLIEKDFTLLDSGISIFSASVDFLSNKHSSYTLAWFISHFIEASMYKAHSLMLQNTLTSPLYYLATGFRLHQLQSINNNNNNSNNKYINN